MKSKPTTIKELCEFIWYLEEKYNLLDFEIDGVKVWQSARMSIYYMLAEATGVLTQPHTKLSKMKKLKHLIGYIKNSFVYNFFNLKQVDTLIFSHPRIINVDGELIDIYTKYFIDELTKMHSIIEFESAYLGLHRKNRQTYTHYTDWIVLFQRIYQFFINPNLLDNEQKILYKVQKEINEVCQININLIAYIIKSIKSFKAINNVYNKIFQKIKPKTFYTVVSYGQAPIIKAAKDNQVEVVELQHGTFSQYHLGYSFPNRNKPLDYFPNKMYVWNNYWKQMLKLPINSQNVVVDKFRYIENEKKKFSHFEKNEHQIVVLSQGAIGNLMAEKFLQHYAKFKNYTIKYKLHPGEFERWQSYPALMRLREYVNVEIIKDEVQLYELFASSTIQVGVFSTALYEGVEFGCKTILLNVNGIEYMDKFIELNNDVEVLK